MFFTSAPSAFTDITYPVAGDLVSLHWDWACDRLSPEQAAILELQTLRHLALANQTL
jgi:hypothetical protein